MDFCHCGIWAVNEICWFLETLSMDSYDIFWEAWCLTGAKYSMLVLIHNTMIRIQEFLPLQARANFMNFVIRRAPVKLSPQNNQHLVLYRPDTVPVTQPTVSKHWRGINITKLRGFNYCHINDEYHARLAGWSWVTATVTVCLKTTLSPSNSPRSQD